MKTRRVFLSQPLLPASLVNSSQNNRKRVDLDLQGKGFGVGVGQRIYPALTACEAQNRAERAKKTWLLGP